MKIIISFGEVKDGHKLALALVGKVWGTIEDVAPLKPYLPREVHITPQDLANAKVAMRVIAKHLL